MLKKSALWGGRARRTERSAPDCDPYREERQFDDLHDSSFGASVPCVAVVRVVVLSCASESRSRLVWNQQHQLKLRPTVG